MTAIPSGTKFLGIAASVDTTEKRSKLNNSYQEYYTMQDIIDQVPAPTTTKVNISSAQILAMGSTPIELLPAPGVGMYYDIEKVILEYTYGTIAYTIDTVDNPAIYFDGTSLTNIPISILTNSINVAFVCENSSVVLSNNVPVARSVSGSVAISTWNDDNPTLGDGTLRAIITYTVRTFGA